MRQRQQNHDCSKASFAMDVEDSHRPSCLAKAGHSPKRFLPDTTSIGKSGSMHDWVTRSQQLDSLCLSHSACGADTSWNDAEA